MAKLIIEIDDLLLTQALLKSQNEQISLDDFIDDALRKILPETNLPTEVVNSIESMLSKAVERANQKKERGKIHIEETIRKFRMANIRHSC